MPDPSDPGRENHTIHTPDTPTAVPTTHTLATRAAPAPGFSVRRSQQTKPVNQKVNPPRLPRTPNREPVIQHGGGGLPREPWIGAMSPSVRLSDLPALPTTDTHIGLSRKGVNRHWKSCMSVAPGWISRKRTPRCVWVAGAGRRKTVETVTTWSSMTSQILALREHLVAEQVSCAQSWRPPRQLLEAVLLPAGGLPGVEVVLVNARHVKNCRAAKPTLRMRPGLLSWQGQIAAHSTGQPLPTSRPRHRGNINLPHPRHLPGRQISPDSHPPQPPESQRRRSTRTARRDLEHRHDSHRLPRSRRRLLHPAQPVESPKQRCSPARSHGLPRHPQPGILTEPLAPSELTSRESSRQVTIAMYSSGRSCPAIPSRSSPDACVAAATSTIFTYGGSYLNRADAISLFEPPVPVRTG